MKSVLIIAICFLALVLFPGATNAQTNEELKAQIEELKKQLEALEEKVESSEEAQSIAADTQELEKRVAERGSDAEGLKKHPAFWGNACLGLLKRSATKLNGHIGAGN